MKYNYEYLSWYSGETIENELWISSALFGDLYKIDLDTYHVEYITNININSKFKEDVYYHADFCFRYKECLYLFVMPGLAYIKYNFENGQTKYFMIDEGEYISSVLKYDDKKLAIISSHPWKKIWMFDMEKEILEEKKCENEIIKEIENYVGVRVLSACLYQKMILMCICGTSIVLSFNVEKNKFHLIKLSDYKLYTVNCNNMDIFFTLTDKNILLKYRPNEELVTKYILDEDYNCVQELCVYHKIIPFNDNILVFPRIDYKKIILINLRTNKVNEICYPFNFKFLHYKTYQLTFWNHTQYMDKIYIYALSGNMMLIFDMKTLQMDGIEICMPKDKNSILKNKIIEQQLFYESIELNLKFWIKNI